MLLLLTEAAAPPVVAASFISREEEEEVDISADFDGDDKVTAVDSDGNGVIASVAAAAVVLAVSDEAARGRNSE